MVVIKEMMLMLTISGWNCYAVCNTGESDYALQLEVPANERLNVKLEKK